MPHLLILNDKNVNNKTNKNNDNSNYNNDNNNDNFFSWAVWSKKWSCVVTETCKLNSNSGGQSTVFKSNINSYKISFKKFIFSICQLEARQCKSAATNQT